MRPETVELAGQQGKVHRFIGGNRKKIADEAPPHRGPEPASHVEREVDRDELDMGEGVPQRDAAAPGPASAALRHPSGRQQLRVVGPRRLVRHSCIEAPDKAAQWPVACHLPSGEDLCPRLRRQQGGADRRSNRSRGVAQSAFAASSTSAACPFTFTRGQTRTILPVVSSR